MKRLVTLLTLSCSVAISALVFVPSASADPVPVGGPFGGLWQEFAFAGPGSFATACVACTPSSGGNSQFAPNPPWTFFILGPKAGNLTVTDAFVRGDVFQVYDFGVPLGTTSAVPTDAGCNNSDPENCLGINSSRVYALSPGPHSITIEAVASPYGSGAAYFRARSASCPPVPIMGPCLVGSGGLLQR